MITENLYASIYRILRPLAKLLLKHGVPYGVFADISRHAYVDVATKEFAIPGRKQSVSRVSVLTGINRKDIAKFRQRSHPFKIDETNQFNRASRVVNAWIRDPRYLDQQGNPKPLPLNAEEASFSELVKSYSGDVPVRALLDELLRINAVRVESDNIVSLLAQGYIPQDDTSENLQIFADTASDLLSTLSHNLEPDQINRRFQRTVAYSNIPEDALHQIRVRSQEEMTAVIRKVNQWLIEHHRDTDSEASGTGSLRAGIGIYYFEEDLEKVPSFLEEGLEEVPSCLEEILEEVPS